MNRLKYLREENRDSQSDIADLLGVSTMTISRWEKADSLQIKPKYAEKLARHFNVSLSYLLSNDNFSNSENKEELDEENYESHFLGAHKQALRLMTSSVEGVKSTSILLKKLVMSENEIDRNLLLEWIELIVENMDNIESTYSILNTAHNRLIEVEKVINDISQKLQGRKKTKKAPEE